MSFASPTNHLTRGQHDINLKIITHYCGNITILFNSSSSCSYYFFYVVGVQIGWILCLCYFFVNIFRLTAGYFSFVINDYWSPSRVNLGSRSQAQRELIRLSLRCISDDSLWCPVHHVAEQQQFCCHYAQTPLAARHNENPLSKTDMHVSHTVHPHHFTVSDNKYVQTQAETYQ